jgi:hypothetical protein
MNESENFDIKALIGVFLVAVIIVGLCYLAISGFGDRFDTVEVDCPSCGKPLYIDHPSDNPNAWSVRVKKKVTVEVWE